MTPAERLFAAGDVLAKRAGAATAPLTGGCFNQDDAIYIASMHPEVGKRQAAMLRVFAYAVDREWRSFHEMWNTEQRVRMLNDRMPGLNDALAIADLILASGQ